MARFSIKDKTTGSVKWEGSPVYHGTYLKPGYLEFTEIASPVPIIFNEGDYVEYSRTGLTYRLHNIPQPARKAASNKAGNVFVYTNVQLFSDAKYLEECPFRDLVYKDSAYFFSTLNSVDTFENVSGIALRLQKNLDDFFGEDTWQIEVASGIPEKHNISEARQFSVSGGSIIDALNQIYEVWDELGWSFSVDPDTGINTLTIGGSNVRTSANTTNVFSYGRGNGLTMLKRGQTNVNEMATVLYAYGSSRNIPNRYYNNVTDESGRHIYQNGSVYIPNLMLPFSQWGKTGVYHDAAKCFLQNQTAIAKYGKKVRYAYFDGKELPEIYPSIEGCTIGNLRSAKKSTATGSPNFYPSTSAYPRSGDRIDEIDSIVSMPTDDGIISGTSGEKYIEEYTGSISSFSQTESQYLTSMQYSFDLLSHAVSHSGRVVIDCAGEVLAQTAVATQNVSAYYYLIANGKVVTGETPLDLVTHLGNSYRFSVPQISYGSEKSMAGGTIKVVVTLYFDFPDSTVLPVSVTYGHGGGSYNLSIQQILTSTFTVRLRQIGFDMMARAALSGNGNPMIVMKDGMCIARNFEVKSARYLSGSDKWEVVCYRGDDASAGMRYPNTSYPVSAGDHFVILDIAMPDEYMGMASDRLLAEAQKLLAQTSSEMPYYEPSIDAKFVLDNISSYPDDEQYKLLEGKYMAISDSQIVGATTDYMLIDTLTINENESSIPTYKVSLRQKKIKSFTASIESAIQSLTSEKGGISSAKSASDEGTAGIPEAPDDGKQYARQNKSWSEVANGTDLTGAVRYDEVQILTASQKQQARENMAAQGSLTAGSNITIAGNVISATGITEAPDDGFLYVRKGGQWVKLDWFEKVLKQGSQSEYYLRTPYGIVSTDDISVETE